VLKNYISLTKPGIIAGNIMTALAGFFLASGRSFSPVIFFSMVVGLSLVIASACVFNNYLDRGLDKKMSRTKTRALVTGAISVRHALVFGGALGTFGCAILLFGTNLLATLMALVGVVAYVIVYGYAKRRSSFGTVIGSVSGAIPPVVGYVAVAGHIDLAAWILFAILVLWQMPHFYAIAIYRSSEYESAHVPVLPLVKGLKATKVQILAYILAFIVATQCLAYFGFAGTMYAIISAALGVGWLTFGIVSFQAVQAKLWARRMFFASLIVLTGLSLVISLGAVIR
jgi:protoheme IX farnesyltransferase